MTKKDLMTGDIIVTRSGYLGVVLKEEDKVLFQAIGSDWLDEYGDDLTSGDEDYPEGDIMEVYRGSSFLDIDNGDDTPIYQRDFSWKRPTTEEREERERQKEEERQKYLEELRKKQEEQRKNQIFIIAQQFYGNRTGTTINRKQVNFFLKGILSPELFPDEDKTVDRQLIKVPNTENIVIVYDKNQEEHYVNVDFPERYAEYAESYKARTGNDFTMEVTCSIPELNIELHTCCFACRIDENGILQSLEDGDGKKIVSYFPM